MSDDDTLATSATRRKEMETRKSPHLNRIRADSLGKSPRPPGRPGGESRGGQSPVPSRQRAESLGTERDRLRVGGEGKDPPYGALEKKSELASHEPDSVWVTLRPIVFSQFLERTAFYGVQGSLVLFLTKFLSFSSGSADAFVGIWSGLCYMTPLLGGFVGDSVLGRWNGILLFFSVYLAGMCLVALSTSLAAASAGLLFFPGALVLAVGSGALKPLVSTFGADQITGASEEEAEKAKEQYFNYLYWFQNCGAFAAFTFMVYLCQDVSFAAGFWAAALCCALSFASLWSGHSTYEAGLPLEDSPVVTFFHVIFEAATSRVVLVDTASSSSGGGARGSGYSPVAAAGSPVGASAAPSWLDRASTRVGGSHGDGDIAMVKKMMTVMPVFFLLVVYWGINSQMSTTFFNQGCQMNLVVAGTLSVPVAALSLFNSVVIILFVPVFDSYVYPACQRSGIPLQTALEKMTAGMALEVLVMALAAVLEVYRKAVADSPDGLVGPSVCYAASDSGSIEGSAAGGVPYAANVSIFWQIPLFVLMGVSEILTSISSMDFFYSEAPEAMKGVCSALELVTVSLGQWLTAFLVPAVNVLPLLLFGGKAWIPSDLNAGYLERFFSMLAALVFVNTFAFSAVARRFATSGAASVAPSEV